MIRELFHALTASSEFLSRIALSVVFSTLAAVKILGIKIAIENGAGSLTVASQIVGLLFLIVVIGLTIFRHTPSTTLNGLEPRLAAFVGTFALISIVLFEPLAQIPDWLKILGLLLVLAGTALSIAVIVWLGRSFSIVPQARHLVTGGPYSVVRHPLYLTEEIAVVGLIILEFSVPVLILVVIHWLAQLRRMHLEEKVLRVAFPEYDEYARKTPRIVPFVQFET